MRNRHQSTAEHVYQWTVMSKVYGHYAKRVSFVAVVRDLMPHTSQRGPPELKEGERGWGGFFRGPRKAAGSVLPSATYIDIDNPAQVEHLSYSTNDHASPEAGDKLDYRNGARRWC